MKVSAVICELNPLHHGHTYLFERVRQKADCIVALMSGNFVQRGETAILDKYARAELAVRGGADLVLELPFPWCAASAEYFAGAGVALADRLSVDTLAFGVGTQDTSMITKASAFFADPDIQGQIRLQNKTDDASAGAAVFREKCLKSFLGDGASDILQSPNDILAIEYLKHIETSGGKLRTQMIRRLTSDDNSQFLGATGIRSLFFDDSLSAIAAHVPPYVYEKLLASSQNGLYADTAKLTELAFSALRMHGLDAENMPADGEGGLFQRILHAALDATSPGEMLSLSATKKYTNARIRRVLLYYLSKISRDILHETPSVTTVLAANPTGCAWLSEKRKDSPIYFITKPAEYRRLDDSARRQYERVLAADRLYTLCMKNTVPADYFLRQSPYILTK